MKIKQMEYKPTNCIVIPGKNQFFMKWLQFLAPLHGLTNKEMEIAAEFLIKRDEIQQSITDNTFVDKVLFSFEKKEEIRNKFGMVRTYFYTVITKFKKAKFIVDERINPKFIPKYSEDKNMCQLLIVFNKNE